MIDPNIQIKREELKGILQDYEYDPDIMNDEPIRINTLKEAMTYLDRSDYIIFCLYVHHQSERKVAAMLGCSRTPINRAIKRIRKEIEDKYAELVNINGISGIRD